MHGYPQRVFTDEDDQIGNSPRVYMPVFRATREEPISIDSLRQSFSASRTPSVPIHRQTSASKIENILEKNFLKSQKWPGKFIESPSASISHNSRGNVKKQLKLL